MAPLDDAHAVAAEQIRAVTRVFRHTVARNPFNQYAGMVVGYDGLTGADGRGTSKT